MIGNKLHLIVALICISLTSNKAKLCVCVYRLFESSWTVCASYSFFFSYLGLGISLFQWGFINYGYYPSVYHISSNFSSQILVCLFMLSLLTFLSFSISFSSFFTVCSHMCTLSWSSFSWFFSKSNWMPKRVFWFSNSKLWGERRTRSRTQGSGYYWISVTTQLISPHPHKTVPWSWRTKSLSLALWIWHKAGEIGPNSTNPPLYPGRLQSPPKFLGGTKRSPEPTSYDNSYLLSFCVLYIITSNPLINSSTSKHYYPNFTNKETWAKR